MAKKSTKKSNQPQEIIRRVEDGVEFFTLEATGESGMSHAGLARFCGVTKQSINELVDKMTTTATGWKVPDCLKPFAGKDNHRQVGTNYKNADILTDDFCGAVVEYYAFEAVKKKEKALFAFRKFAKLGVRTFIQFMTGWKPAQQKPKNLVDYLVSDERIRWNVDLHGGTPFQIEFYQHLYRIRGGEWAERDPRNHQRPACVGGWTNKLVYERAFADEVAEKLHENYKANPGSRKYENLTEMLGQGKLKSHTGELLAVMRVAPSDNWNCFLRILRHCFST